jgi:hypothetical protein
MPARVWKLSGKLDHRLLLLPAMFWAIPTILKQIGG